MTFRYIQPEVLQRLNLGQFEPNRRPSGEATGNASQERRGWLSPLAITKRCLRYESKVFDTWTPEILQLANQLNDPAIRVISLVGPEGCGKTALMRAAVELMGGGPEQLIWYDALPQADPGQCFDSIMDTLIYLAETLVPHAMAPDRLIHNASLPPLERLPLLLTALEDIPLLVVIDQVDTLVNSHGHWRSPLVREAIFQLLNAPNVKLALVGEQLPAADLTPWRQASADLTPPRLDEQNIRQLLQTPHPQAVRSVIDENLIQLLTVRMEGAPWLIRAVMTLGQFSSVNLDDLKLALTDAPAGELATAEALVQFLWHRLEPGEQSLLTWVGMIRHPMGEGAMGEILPALDQTLLSHFSKGHIARGSLLRALLRQRLTTQSVITALRHPTLATGGITPWAWLYRPVRKVIADLLPPEARAPRHERLAAFYREELDRPVGQRLSGADNTFLEQEKTWHRQQEAEANASFRPEAHPVQPAASDDLALRFQSQPDYASQPVQPAANPSPISVLPFKPGADSGREGMTEVTAGSPAFNVKGNLVLPSPINDDLSFHPSPLGRGTLRRNRVRDCSPLPLGEGVSVETGEGTSEGIVQLQTFELPVLLSPAFRLRRPRHRPIENAPTSDLPSYDSVNTTLTKDTLSDTALTSLYPDPAQGSGLPHVLAEVKPFAQAYRQAMARGDGAGQIRALLRFADTWQIIAATDKERANRLARCAHRVEAVLPQLPGWWKAAWYLLQGDTSRALNQLGAAQAFYRAGWVMLEEGAVSLTGTGAASAFQDLRLRLALALGLLADLLAQPEKAHHWLALAFQIALADDTGLSDTQRAAAVFAWAGQLEAMGRIREAVLTYEQSLALDETACHWPGCSAALTNLGRLHQQAGHRDQAGACWLRSLALDEQTGDLGGQLSTLDALCSLLHESGASAQAETRAQQLLTLATASHLPEWTLRARLHLAELAETGRQDFAAALRYYDAIQREDGWERLTPASQCALLARRDDCKARAKDFFAR